MMTAARFYDLRDGRDKPANDAEVADFNREMSRVARSQAAKRAVATKRKKYKTWPGGRKKKQMPFRFWIAAVVTQIEDGRIEIREKAGAWYETISYNSAAAEAESRWPGEQISVTKVGRIHTGIASDVVPLTDSM